MSGISFENGCSWMVRNWAFDAFMNEVIKDHNGFPEIAEACKAAIANYGLHFNILREEGGSLSDRVFIALEKTTQRILAEENYAFTELGEDREGRRLLLGNVARLSELLEHIKNSETTGPNTEPN